MLHNTSFGACGGLVHAPHHQLSVNFVTLGKKSSFTFEVLPWSQLCTNNTTVYTLYF